MKKSIKNKKGLDFKIVVSSIMFVAILGSLVFIFNQLRVKAQTVAEETECIASIEAHASFVESQLLTTEIVDMHTAGIGSLFIDTTAEPPPIKCSTKILRSKAKSSDDTSKEIVISLIENWFMFKQGKKAFYPGLEKKNFCHVTQVIKFKDIPELELWTTIDNTQLRTIMKNHDSPKTIMEYFDEGHIDDNHIFEHNIAVPVASNNSFAYFQVYYPGKLIWEELDENAKISNLQKWFGHTKWYQKVVGESLDTSYTVQELVEAAFYAFFDNFDGDSLKSSMQENVPYAVIFFQTHDYPSDLANIAGDEFYPFIFSAIMVLPYTEDAMSQVQCDYMPVEFQNFN